MKRLVFTMFLICLVLFSCEKEQKLQIEPQIILSDIKNYVGTNTSLAVGEQYKVQIEASSNNGENITNLIVKSNGNRVFDNGYNTPSLTEEISLTKSNEEKETITFIVRNKARLADSVSIEITKLEKEYGNIFRQNSIVLGCHENLNIGNYYSINNNLVYIQSEAFNNQNLIDIVYFYDASEDLNALGSPAANISSIITGSDAPENWEIKRTTRYTPAPLDITDNEFTNSQNDSLIVAHLFTGGKRKAKKLSNNIFYGLVNEEGKYGIIKIEEVVGEANGTIKFSLIMQK